MLNAILIVASFLVPAPMTCQETAELHWAMAESAGANADAAYEDTYAACTEGR